MRPPNSIENWGYLGNSCLQLDLYDEALYSYRRAEKLTDPESPSQWITANIGNLLINKDLPTEACKYLERAVKFEPHSEYAHERLASALRKKSSETKEFKKKCAEGKRQLREAVTKIVNPSTTESDKPRGLLSNLLIPNSPPQE